MCTTPVAVEHVNSCGIVIFIELRGHQGDHGVPYIPFVIEMKDIAGDHIPDVFGKVFVIFASLTSPNATIDWQALVPGRLVNDYFGELFAFSGVIIIIIICIMVGKGRNLIARLQLMDIHCLPVPLHSKCPLKLK